MAVEAVVFDIGNVLIEWRPERFYDQEIGAGRRAALFDAVDLSGMNDRIDMGGPFQETIYEEAERNPEWRNEIRLWHDRWIELASPEIPHSVRLLRALRRKGIPVFSLTNFGIGSFDHARGFYPFLDEFDRQFISGHLGMIKPDPRIYEAVERESGLQPEALIFADDRADNVEAARARGWRAHLFDGPDGWAERLVSEDLLTPEEAQ